MLKMHMIYIFMHSKQHTKRMIDDLKAIGIPWVINTYKRIIIRICLWWTMEKC